MVKSLYIEVGAGELIDKITILEIKSARLSDSGKLQNVLHELSVLEKTAGELSHDLKPLKAQLKAINEALWDIENGKRDCEKRQDFGAEFIQLARLVYLKNDERAAVKRLINIECESAIIEEKSY